MFFKNWLDHYADYLKGKFENISWSLTALVSVVSSLIACVLAIAMLFVVVDVTKNYGPWPALGIFIVWCFVEFFTSSLSIVLSNIALEKSIEWGRKFFNKQN